MRGYTQKRITVPGNLAIACAQFNAGQFWECHETLEEIWQEETGEIRDLYKGLIQVAAGFVHVSRGNYRGAVRLLQTGEAYLAPYRPAALGFDVAAICDAAFAARERVLAQGPDATALLPGMAPRLTCDAAKLPAEARRWRPWGFDRDGNPQEMEITVAE